MSIVLTVPEAMEAVIHRFDGTSKPLIRPSKRPEPHSVPLQRRRGWVHSPKFSPSAS